MFFGAPLQPFDHFRHLFIDVVRCLFKLTAKSFSEVAGHTFTLFFLHSITQTLPRNSEDGDQHKAANQINNKKTKPKKLTPKRSKSENETKVEHNQAEQKRQQQKNKQHEIKQN